MSTTTKTPKLELLAPTFATQEAAAIWAGHVVRCALPGQRRRCKVAKQVPPEEPKRPWRVWRYPGDTTATVDVHE